MFSCCFWWFLLGALIGWLLHWLLSRLFKSDHHDHSGASTQATYAPISPEPIPPARIISAPVAKVAEMPKPVAFVLDAKAAKAAGFKLRNADDLTVVEGIGPKINELFINAGINTFDKLSKTPVAKMQSILDAAGPRYKLAVPTTWAEQAKLANENKWAELKAWQDKLNHGQ